MYRVNDLEFALSGDRSMYLLYAVEIRPRYYQITLASLDLGPGAEVQFDKQLYSTQMFAANVDLVTSTLLHILHMLDENTIDDPFEITAVYGGVSNLTPLPMPQRST